MESIILMNSKWGNDIFVPMYLFFGGLSGGLFVIAVAAQIDILFSSTCSCAGRSFYCLSPGQTRKRNIVPFFLQEL